MPAYYNEIDRYPARWLKNLIANQLIPQGEVDERSILQVEPDELGSFRQCHFFAGIGGWAYALALAGWPEDRDVWTASCPCQPLSSAGRRAGHADERHLWPAFYRLVAECRPATIFGEQVASKDGREWLAGIRADLEQLGYAVGCADLPAACVGAPHIRQRLFWVADAQRRRSGQTSDPDIWAGGQQFSVGWSGAHSGLGVPNGAGSQSGQQAGSPVGYGHPAVAAGHWDSAVWLPCLDGKARRVEPGTFPLADGVPARVGRLRAYGNAIVPQAAAEFIRAAADLANHQA